MRISVAFLSVAVAATTLAEQSQPRGYAIADTSSDTKLLNISTRMRVLAGDQVLIAGFIITGSDPKKIIIRGIGPSLNGVGVPLADPTLELHQGSATLAMNDNWKVNDQTGQSQEADIRATTIPPNNDLESALVITLNPGAYTAILAGKNGGPGVGLVEVYDLAQGANSKLANISTRGFVDTGSNVMIGGLIVGGGSGGGAANVIVRAIGPSLPVPGALGDPTLELHDGNGTTIATNDNWSLDDQTGQSQGVDIRATTIPPANDLESALLAILTPGNYTAIVSGKNNATGIGVVEAYALPDGHSLLPVRGIFTNIEHRGTQQVYNPGDLLHNWEVADPATGLTAAQETALQFDKMREMDVNHITMGITTADPTYTGTFQPPECNMPPAGGLQWPQPTNVEIKNLKALFDLAQQKGIRMILHLANNHQEEQPPTNSQTWLGAVLNAIGNHPALDIVLFDGDEHIHQFNPPTCGVPAEPPLWLGPSSYAGVYVKWAIQYALSLGVPANRLSAEAVVGSYNLESKAARDAHVAGDHLWSPIAVLKNIFDSVGMPDSQRVYALSFYEHRKCVDADQFGPPCTEEDPAPWAEETAQYVTSVTGTGARVVATEMGILEPVPSNWTTPHALEHLYFVLQKYGMDGGCFWKWVAQNTSEENDNTHATPVKRLGLNFLYNPVQKEIAGTGGFHLFYIPNHSFEAGNAVPANWTATGQGSVARYFLGGEAGQPEVPSRGSYSLRLVTGNGPADHVSAISALIPASPSMTYTTTANLRFNFSGDPNPSAPAASRPQVAIVVHYLTSNGSASPVKPTDTFTYFQENSTGSFGTFPMVYSTPADTAALEIEFAVIRNGLPSPITLDVDNVR